MLAEETNSQNYVVAGYYPDWMYEVMPPKNINYAKVTHIIHFSVWVDNIGNLKYEDGFLKSSLIDLAHKNNVKVLLAVGGNARSDNFANVAKSFTLRKKFINNLSQFVKQYNYDGVDWDWEFPSDSLQGESYLKLIKDLREEFDTFNKSLIITLATSSGNWIGQHFDYQKIEKYVNWFYLMTYDYHGSWLDHTGHNAPLTVRANEQDGSVAQSVNYLKNEKGVPSNKIVLGIPFYGRIYKSTGLYKPFDEVKNINYSEVDSLRKSGWKSRMDSYSKVPYLQNKEKTEFITYENPTSIKYKADFIKKNRLAGAMVWSMGQDLVNNKQILLEKISDELFANRSQNDERINLNQPILYNNTPNPFNPITTIKYYIPKSNRGIVPVKLIIYDSLGQEISVLVNKYHKPGEYEVNFEATGLMAGSYIYELIVGKKSIRKQMTLVN